MYNLLYLHKIIKIKLDTKIKPSQYEYKIVFKILFLYCISPTVISAPLQLYLLRFVTSHNG